MKVLVTGGAGYIGSHTCRELKAQGLEPIVYDDLSRGHAEAVKWGPLIRGRLQETEKLTRVLQTEKISSIIHFAAYAYVGESMESPELYYENNFQGTLSLLQAMRKSEVRKLVFSSTCATYGEVKTIPIKENFPQNPVNPYGRSKLMIETMLNDVCRAYDISSVILRYFNAAGASPDGDLTENHEPETHLIPLVIRATKNKSGPLKIFGNQYPTPDGTCIRDYIHVCDLASAHYLALKKLNDQNKAQVLVYNLGTGKGYSVKEVIDCTEKVSNLKVPTEITKSRPGDPPILIADASLAKQDLGWAPKYSSLESIIQTAWGR